MSFWLHYDRDTWSNMEHIHFIQKLWIFLKLRLHWYAIKIRKILQTNEEQKILKYMDLTKMVRVAFHLFFSPGRASNLAALRSDSLTKSPLQSHVTFGLGHACTWASKIRIEGSGCFSSGCSYILAGTLSSSSGFPPSIDEKITLSIKKAWCGAN